MSRPWTPGSAAAGPVTFDASSSAEEIAGDGVISVSHTATGSDLAAFAGNMIWASSQTTDSITYDGAGMTEQWDLDQTNSSIGNAGYTKAGIPSGLKTVTATSPPGVIDYQAIGVMTMTGVNQTTPVGTAATDVQGSGSPDVTDPSVTVGSVGANDLVVDFAIIQQNLGSITAGANQTDVVNIRQDYGDKYQRASYQAGTGGGVMSWSVSGESYCYWAQGAIAFKPV
jgi:hypothetical protein